MIRETSLPRRGGGFKEKDNKTMKGADIMTKKRVIKFSLLVIVMLLIFAFLSVFLVRTTTSTEIHVKNFFKEPENSLDVAFIGSSEMYADYSPPLAYDKYGYTGYNFCYEGAPANMYIPMLDVFLSRQDPKLVVIEVNGYFYSEEYCNRDSNYRRLIDNMPLSKQRFDMIDELIKPEEKMSYYFPLIKYHSNWQSPQYQIRRLQRLIGMNDEEYSHMKSFGTKTAVNMIDPKVKKRQKSRVNNFTMNCLDEMIAYCKDKGLENVLFIRAPHKRGAVDKSIMQIQEVVEASGYKFVDFSVMGDEIGIDPETDYYNPDHLNVFGSEKFTDYLGRYITENYQLPTTHSEEIDKQWQDCAQFTKEAFEDLKAKTLEGEGRTYNEWSMYKKKKSA